ncbi:uncharacterized protein [Nicotiana tomentosiformis]|uniref:uncharacterized protein n=1 Tax=Nicotiana tomentosiformis TaxID=4098 RepID=UPI00388CACE4
MSLIAREFKTHLFKHHINQAQQRMFSQANHHKSDRQFQKIGTVAYKLSLPSNITIHPTFHVSLLKPYYKVPDNITHPPVMDITSPYYPTPKSILDRRMIKNGNKAIAQVLVQWEQMPGDQTTWEDYHVLKTRFPAFLP